MQHSPTIPHPLPCVVQLGFAGSRRLFVDAAETARREAAVEKYLIERIGRLRQDLKLQANHFLVGISQLACGADTLFSRACFHMPGQPIPQRVFLPQDRERFLSAVGSDGTPDFTPAERAAAESLLAEPHIIQERVVSQSADRTTQFVDVNAEILRVSDVIVCLLRADAGGQAGGTNELLERAKRRGTPVLEIRVGLEHGEPTFAEQWHNLEKFQPPRLPEELAHESVRIAVEPLPTRDEFCQPLKDLVSRQAKWHQRLFKFAAAAILFTHTLATVCATLAVALHKPGEHHPPAAVAYAEPAAEHAEPAAKGHAAANDGHAAANDGHAAANDGHAAANDGHAAANDGHAAANDGHDRPAGHAFSAHDLIVGLLAVELLLLVAGFLVHWHLHRSHAARVWAVVRVVAELARSLRVIGSHAVYLEHLFRLPLPHHFRPLLRTLSVLHLRSTWPNRLADWRPHRDAYLADRVDDQIGFYEKRLIEDKSRLSKCQWVFTACSLLAIFVTLPKLLLIALGLAAASELWLTTFGVLAIVLPVIAVGGLSWAAALDCEARVETFGETLAFLRRQRPFLEQATSAAEFERLLLETETILLGEVTNWFSRRSNTGVT